MNRLLPILVLFSLILAGSASAAEIDWDGLPQFQRGNRITPSHMNDIIDALDSVKLEVDAMTVGGSDSIRVNNGVPTIANSIFDLRDGDGINITLGENSPTGTDSATFDIDIFATGPGIEFSTGALSLLRTCTNDQILQWDTTAGWECQSITAGGGGGGADMTVNGLGVVTNFSDGEDTGSTLYVDFLAVSADVTGSIDMSAITQLGTITTPTTIANQLTLSTSAAEILFSSTGTASCAGGQGSIYWDAAEGRMMKCEGAVAAAIAGENIVDPILIDSTAVNDENGVNFLGGDGVTVTHDDGVSPDTATVAVALGTNQGLEVNGGTLGLINDCANDEVLVWNGSAWVCGSRISGSSSVTLGAASGGTGTNISSVTLQDTSTVNVTDTSGTVTFDVIGTGITSLGTQTTKFTTDETGIEFQAQTGITTCAEATFGTNGGIFYDGDSDALKKCENGTLTDLAPDVNNITGPMGITGTTSNPTNLLDLIPSVDGSGIGNAGQPAFKIFGFNPVTGGASASVNTTNPVFEVDHNGVVGITNNLVGGSRGGATNWTVLPSGVAQFQAIEDTDGPGTNFSITSAGAATFADSLTVGNGMGVTDGAVTIGGTASTADTDVQIGGDLANLTVDGVLTVKAGGNERILVLEAAGASPPASTMMELQDGASNAVFRIRKDGYVTVQRIGDIDGPGNNWIIDEAGAANFTNTTVEDLTSTGTLAHSGGTATLSSGATDTVALGDGAGTLAGKVEIGGTQNQPQLVIEGHSDQTDSIVVVQDHLDEEIFNVNADGAVYAQSINDIDTGSSNWSIAADGTTDLGNTNVGGNLVTTGDTDTHTLGVGAVTTTSGKVEIGGEANEVQLVVQGNSDQSNDVILVERSDGTDVFTLSNFGMLGVQSIQDIDGPGTNWSINGSGQASFSSTTVAGITSQGYITQTAGTALLAPGDGDELRIGGGIAGSNGKVEIGATGDQPQLMVKGHSTQTDSIVIVQDDADTEVFNVNADGRVYAESVSDMEWCEDLYNNVTGAEQESGIPDGICDSDGSTLQTGKWNVTDKGRASFADLSFNSCVDENGVGDSGIPQTTGASDGLCDDDGITPANGRLVFNDAGFDGTTDYVGADGPGAGQNAGALAARDGFIQTNCISEDSYSSFSVATETGCNMTLASGRRAGASAAPHITLQDSVLLPGNALEASVTQIQIGAPIVPLNAVGSTAQIAMGGSPISGAIKITNVSGGSNVIESRMVNQWFFITSGGGTISLSTLTQVGRSGCFYASSAHEFTIQTEDDGTGSHIFLNGQEYFDGASTSPSITSSGSQGDFVCLLSANPNDDAEYEWYVLGQSGTFTGADGS